LPKITISGLALILLISASSAAWSATDNTPQNADAVSSEWRVLGGGADVWHYSPLNQINETNVGKLGLAWAVDIPSPDGLVGNPLVAEGVVYQSGPPGRIYANDIRTGALLWVYDPTVQLDHHTAFPALWSSHFNRGLALQDDSLYVATGDCQLISVHRKTGKEQWRTQACDSTKGYGITQAPRVGGGNVYIGNNCADLGLDRGYVDAYDAATGARKWRFYTMPGDPSKPFESDTMEMASKTWGTDYWEKTRGCVSPWDAMTYDEKLDLLYIGTGAPAPWDPNMRAEDAGDELFSNSVVAVNASSGEYVWHYQTVQQDGWDFDAALHMLIAELPIDGKPQRVVMTAPKNGFFYVLDALTGKLISANNYVPVNWASHIDLETGRPVTIPDARYWERKDQVTVASPGPMGAHSWQANSYNPESGLVYMPVMSIPTRMTPDPTALAGGMLFDMYYGDRGDPNWQSGGELIAWDPISQSARWRVDRGLPIGGGVLSTAGNLVFQGSPEGTFDAFSAETGDALWSFNAHGVIQSAPTSVLVYGEQFILVASGNAGAAGASTYLARYATTSTTRSPSRLLAFKLGGKEVLSASEVPTVPKPPLPRASSELVEQGNLLYQTNACVACHGIDVENVRSSIPDLRYASAETHRDVAAIVLGGVRVSKGMPAYPHVTQEELSAIQAYILDEAWNAYEKETVYKKN
jgi:PQQ-dependent dehydrogenase (methanol/ethanol family)